MKIQTVLRIDIDNFGKVGDLVEVIGEVQGDAWDLVVRNQDGDEIEVMADEVGESDCSANLDMSP